MLICSEIISQWYCMWLHVTKWTIGVTAVPVPWCAIYNNVHSEVYINAHYMTVSLGGG